ncbi:envelope glycoprotein B [Trifolium repens]|nr:envelope glycoprotein B [Trifolium repens]
MFAVFGNGGVDIIERNEVVIHQSRRPHIFQQLNPLLCSHSLFATCQWLLHFCFLLTFFFLFFHSSTSSFLSQLTSGKENEGNGVAFSRWDEIAAEPFENSPPLPFENSPSLPFENSPSSLPLAAERTRRKDPFDGFNKYTNGWNISNHHYWTSVSYTAVPVFSIAAIWFLGFGLCLLLLIVGHFCRKSEPYGYSTTCYSVSLILLILFTFTTLIGCAVLYIGQGSFHRSTTTTLQYVVYQADSAVDKLRNVSDYLAQAKLVGIDRVFLPANVQTDIDTAEADINTSAGTISEKTKENSANIQDLLDSVRMALIIIAAVMLVLTFLGFLFSIFGMQVLVYIWVVAGWFLVTGTLILCGLFVILHNVTADTCVAMNEWNQYPTANTALDDILPCVDNATAQETLSRSKEVTSELVNLVNQVITNVSNINFAPNFTPLYYNQSGPLMPLLCDPFRPDMTDRQCDSGEVNLSNATQVYGNFVCQASPSEICTTQGRLTPTFYNQISAGINIGNALYNYAPSLVELQDCTFVRETFTDIYNNHCPGLRRYSRWIYAGLVTVSFAVMFSLIFWVVYGRERRHRLYTKESKDLVTPTRTPARAPTRAPPRAPTRAPPRAPTRAPPRAPTRAPPRAPPPAPAPAPTLVPTEHALALNPY